MVDLSSIEKDLLIAEPIVPAFIALLYGSYKFFDLGFSMDHYLYTYALVFGAGISSICVAMYVNSGPDRSAKNALITLGGFVPYIFSIYLMGFLGAYSLWGLLSEFTFGTLAFGIFWMIVGYRMLYTFWMITEIKSESL